LLKGITSEILLKRFSNIKRNIIAMRKKSVSYVKSFVIKKIGLDCKKQGVKFINNFNMQ